MKSHRLFPLLATAALLCGPVHLWADAQATSTLQFLNLQITPASGTLSLGTPLDLSAFAQAQNSLGESQADFQSDVSGTIVANAMVTDATAHGEVSDLRTGLASGNSTIPGSGDFHAETTGRGTYADTFMITGGTGPVNVAFSALVNGSVNLLTDGFGSADAEAVFSLQLDGDPVLFFQSQHSGGPDSDVSDPISQLLSDSRTLQFGTTYELIIETDAETSATTVAAVPEPSTCLWGVVIATMALGARARRNRQSSLC